jgi:hypothetical protein
LLTGSATSPDGDQVTVEVVVQAGAKTQPLTELHLLVDGRLAFDKDDKVMVKSFATPPAKEVKETWTVKLEPGRHTLSVRALAKDTYSISDEVRLLREGETQRGDQAVVRASPVQLHF